MGERRPETTAATMAGGGRSSVALGTGVVAHGRSSGGVLGAPANVLRTVTLSDAAEVGSSHGGELRSGWPKGLEEEIDRWERGVGSRGSRRCRRGGQRARGGPGGAESTGGELMCPRLKTRQKRRCGAPTVERTCVDDERDDAGPSGCFGKARGGRWPRFHGGERLAVAAMARRGQERGQRGRVKRPRGRGGTEEKARGVVVASVTQASRKVCGAAGARALSPSSAYWQR